jgi:hypothetical protein
MVELKYSFEYFCSPIWVKNNQKIDSIFENINVDLIPISDKLKKEINELNIIYQSTYNDDYPPEPKSLQKNEDLFFSKRIIESAKYLSKELSLNYKILFDRNKWENRINILENENPQS